MNLRDKIPADTKQTREGKLSEALRANLRRRKAVDRNPSKPVADPTNESQD